tara:strand:+ start:357 stop:530 length:174 start_codon:yes stop_codon:yes gene_type:complete
MKNFYYNLKFFVLMVFFIGFYYIAIKPITTTYLEGFEIGNFKKFSKTFTKRLTLNII